MCRIYGKFASYLRRVLCKTRLIFPRINGPIVSLPIRMKGNSKRTSGNSLSPLGAQTRISAMLRRRYWPMLNYVCDAGWQQFAECIKDIKTEIILFAKYKKVTFIPIIFIVLFFCLTNSFTGLSSCECDSTNVSRAITRYCSLWKYFL